MKIKKGIQLIDQHDKNGLWAENLEKFCQGHQKAYR